MALYRAQDASNAEQPVELPSSRDGPLVALAFKLEEGKFGQLTYMRIYSGTICKGDNVINVVTGKRIKVRTVPIFTVLDRGIGSCMDEVLWVWSRIQLPLFIYSTVCWQVPRLVRMHSKDMEDISEAGAGDIVAMFGIECSTGDTFTDGSVRLCAHCNTLL